MTTFFISCVDDESAISLRRLLLSYQGIIVYSSTNAVDHNFVEEDFDDTEEWAMTEYEFRDWYYTHSHKQTMAFYNFYMDDFGNFRKISPKVVERELYLLWKDNPQLFTDMVCDFDFDEDVDDYTYC